MELFDRVKHWIAKPFDPSMSVGGWFLFFGLFVAIGVAWNSILVKIKET